MNFKQKIITGLLIATIYPTYVMANVDLNTVYKQAMNNSQSLKSDQATFHATKEGNAINLGALLPAVDLSAGLNSNYYSGTSAATGLPISGSYQSSSLGVTASQVLFDYSLYNTYKSAKQTSLGAQATYESQKQTLIVDVAKAYFNVLFSEDEVAFSKANLEALESTLKQVKLKFKVGVATDSDVKTAMASYYTAYATERKNENTLETSYYKLYEYTGITEKQLAKLKANINFSYPQPTNAQHWIDEAKANNMQLQSQRYTTLATEDTMDASKGAFMPTVSLIASYSVAGNYGNSQIYVGAGASAHTSSGYIGLAFSWNIFNGGTDFATQIQNANKYESQQYTQLDSLRTVEAQTKSDYLQVIALVDQIHALQASVKSSELAYEQFLERYKVGTSTITDVLDQLTTLFDAKSDLAEAKYNYILALLQLKLDTGSLSTSDINQVNAWLQ